MQLYFKIFIIRKCQDTINNSQNEFRRKRNKFYAIRYLWCFPEKIFEWIFYFKMSNYYKHILRIFLKYVSSMMISGYIKIWYWTPCVAKLSTFLIITAASVYSKYTFTNNLQEILNISFETSGQVYFQLILINKFNIESVSLKGLIKDPTDCLKLVSTFRSNLQFSCMLFRCIWNKYECWLIRKNIFLILRNLTLKLSYH